MKKLMEIAHKFISYHIFILTLFKHRFFLTQKSMFISATCIPLNPGFNKLNLTYDSLNWIHIQSIECKTTVMRKMRRKSRKDADNTYQYEQLAGDPKYN